MDANELRQPIGAELQAIKERKLSLAAGAKRIRQMIARAKFPPAMAEAIRTAYRRLSKGAQQEDLDVAVRSSATAEDLPVCGELLILGKSVIRHTQPGSASDSVRSHEPSGAAAMVADQRLAPADRQRSKRGPAYLSSAEDRTQTKWLAPVERATEICALRSAADCHLQAC